jgi:hypothetical protein
MVFKPVSPPMVVKPSFFSTIRDGFGFGVGSAIAHRVVDNVFSVTPPDQKKLRNFAYEQCLSENADFIDSASICAHHLMEAKEKPIGNK